MIRSSPFLSLLILLLCPGPIGAQTPSTLTWQGEIRPRLLAREPVEDAWDHWISMRTRFAVDARMGPTLGAFIQVQDVRYWGEEATLRDRSADAIDFHQAYLEVDSLPGIGGLLRGGRQEVSLAQARFVAAPDWGQAGQTFDGVRWMGGVGSGNLDLVYLRLRENSSDTHEASADLLAAWLRYPGGALGSLDVLAIHDRSGMPAGTAQSTVGSAWTKETGPLSLHLHGMLQFGERGGEDLSAFFLAARGSLTFLDENGTVTLWYDHLSGDDDPDDGKVRSFSTLFGARHRFYGRADYFVSIPDDTGGLGLQDAAMKLAYVPGPLLSLNLDLHAFLTSERGTLSGRRLAEEADLWIRYRFREALRLEAGYSLIRAGPALEELDRLQGTGHVVYLMTSLRF